MGIGDDWLVYEKAHKAVSAAYHTYLNDGWETDARFLEIQNWHGLDSHGLDSHGSRAEVDRMVSHGVAFGMVMDMVRTTVRWITLDYAAMELIALDWSLTNLWNCLLG